MEKIRLKNGTEFELVPMGIGNFGEVRTFKFISTLDYSETLQQFINTENIETIEHILSDGSVVTTYMDCVNFNNLTYSQLYNEENETIESVYTVELSVNEVERMLMDVKRKITTLENENAMLKEQNSLLTETVDYLVLSKLEKDTELPLTPIETPEEESEVEENV